MGSDAGIWCAIRSCQITKLSREDANRWALVMAGVNSKIAPREQMEKMRDALPNAKLVLFEGYTQGIAFSAPQRCVREMLTFIAELKK